jgi:hypothetical protein
MIRAAVVLALICAAIQNAWLIASSEDGLTAYDPIFLLIFGAMGAGSAYIFAETLTSLCLIFHRQRFIWQVLPLFITGNLIGIFVFLFITGNIRLWVLGGLIGVMLAILNSIHLPNPALIRWGLGGGAGILAGITAYLLLQSTVPEAREVISAALFTAGYIFFAVKP